MQGMNPWICSTPMLLVQLDQYLDFFKTILVLISEGRDLQITDLADRIKPKTFSMCVHYTFQEITIFRGSSPTPYCRFSALDDGGKNITITNIIIIIVTVTERTFLLYKILI